MKKLSVIGIGKLGLCFALTLEKNGYNVVGVDIDEDYIMSINEKTLKSTEPDVEEYLKRSNNFYATTSLKDAVYHSDVLFVVVATPSMLNGRYDHGQIDSIADKLKEYGRQERPKHLVVCCTAMPEYCDRLQEKVRGLNYVVSYNPEFIAQGTILRDQENPDLVLIGEGSQAAGDILEEIYNNVCKSEPNVARMSPLSAEITKLALNCFLTTKIAYANMIGDIAIQADAEHEKILKAIGADTRIGGKYLRYGYGYGGPCFPRDNRALAIYSNFKGIDALISTATDKSNHRHLQFQIQKFQEQRDLKEKIVLGPVSYKPESVLIEESQQLAFAVGLASSGFNVIIEDKPEVLSQVERIYGDLFTYKEKK